MSEQTSHDPQADQARSHIQGLLAAVCAESVAHHNYWAWHYAARIGDEQLRAQIEAELQAATRAKE